MSEEIARAVDVRLPPLFRASPVAIVLGRVADGRILDVNDAFLRFFGYERAEVLGHTSAELEMWADPSQRGELVQAIRAGQPVRDFEAEVRTKDGRRRHALVAIDVTDVDGETCILSYLYDVTARKEAEELYRTLFENSLIGVLLTAPDGRVLAANAAACEMFGYSEAEFRRLGRAAVVDPTDPRLAQALAERERTGMVTAELRLRRKDGTTFPAEVFSRVFVDRDGQLRTSMLIRDASARAEAEAALRRAREEAEAANLAKSEFLSRMSHELRTPLNAILGFGQLLALEALAPSQEEAVDHVLRAGRHLLGLIDEVLDIARIEAGQLPVSPEPVRIDDVVIEAVALIGHLGSRYGVVIKADDAVACHRYVRADRQRLIQVLVNLLANGAKYNRPGGSVEVTCAEVPAAEGAARLRIAVRDTGMGIAPEKQGRLFTPFDRLGAEQSGVEGTGLGLALSRRLVEAMGGELGVASTPGEGSTFWVDLPIAEEPGARPQPASAPAEIAGAGPQGTVLYIEDNLSNVALIERTLAPWPGLRLLSAMQGSLGLELARVHRPGLILLDLHLPDLPGHEVLHRLRADPATAGIPVVVVSADATPGQARRLLADGALAFLTKPIDVVRFRTVVAEALDLAHSGDGRGHDDGRA